ncbi:MAG: methylmalonyl-CoA mutase family protein, partial [Candidatus Limnocylindrales bacterium]
MTDRASERSRWETERLEPALARTPERRVRFSTMSDVEVERLYGPWDVAAAGAASSVVLDPPSSIGFPGEPPFTRGIHPTGYRSRLWTMRMFAGFGAAEDTNARFR